MTLVLGLDVGTQGTKGLLLDVGRGAVLARAGRPYGLLEGLPPGSAEQHPRTWTDAVQEVVPRLLADAAHAQRRAPAQVGADVVALAVSGQQHGLVALDARGEVVRPAKLWCDTSTAAEASELSARLSRRVPAGYTASKVLWLARHEPQAWARTASVLLPHDFVNLWLTGRATAEAGDASGTGFFDPVERTWDRAVAAVVDPALFDKLPPLLLPGEPAGTLRAEIASRLGLREGTLVAAGSGDNMASALGSGCSAPGVAVVSLGTSATLFAFSRRPVLDPGGLVAPFCDATGGWLPLLCVMNGTLVTEEVRQGWPALSLEQLTEAAARVPPGCDGLLWLPYLQGERVPDLPRAAGSLHGMRAGAVRPGVLFRAALEGVSLLLAWGAERMAAAGVAVEAVRVVGGGAGNALWRGILADALAVPVQRVVESESAALGAALAALWTWRRAQGEDVSAHEVAAPWIALVPEVDEPDATRGALYAEQLRRMRELTGMLHGDE